MNMWLFTIATVAIVVVATALGPLAFWIELQDRSQRLGFAAFRSGKSVAVLGLGGFAVSVLCALGSLAFWIVAKKQHPHAPWIVIHPVAVTLLGTLGSYLGLWIALRLTKSRRGSRKV